MFDCVRRPLVLVAFFLLSEGTGREQVIGQTPLFPPEAEVWKESQAELLQGLVEAEALRQKLLSNDAVGNSFATAIATALSEFQAASQTQLTEGISIASFDVTPQRLNRQIRGEVSLSADAFQAFDGRWFGRWGESEVNHDWRPSVEFTPPRRLHDEHAPVVAMQYAWISNGFGWNYLMAAGESEGGNLILGMVYYLEHDDLQKISGSKPHVGFSDSPTRLVWITKYEVFLEEVFPAIQGRSEQYVITTLYHNLLAETPTISPHGTQAIYTRDPNCRPLFRKFTWSETSEIPRSAK